MSLKDRAIEWCEGKILRVLSKHKKVITDMALSWNVLEGVRSINEQHHLDIAIANLLSKRQITRETNDNGFTIYNLAA